MIPPRIKRISRTLMLAKVTVTRRYTFMESLVTTPFVWQCDLQSHDFLPAQIVLKLCIRLAGDIIPSSWMSLCRVSYVFNSIKSVKMMGNSFVSFMIHVVVPLTRYMTLYPKTKSSGVYGLFSVDTETPDDVTLKNSGPVNWFLKHTLLTTYT